MFSSSIFRMQILVDLAAQFDRQVAFIGRGVNDNAEIAQRLGFLRIPAGVLIRDSDVSGYPSQDVVCICTGSQGEPQAALPRIAIDDHRHVRLDPDDIVVFSAREIPGNEKAIGRVMNHVARRGAEIITDGMKHVHVSGHGSEEELKLVLSLVQADVLRADTWGVPPAGAARAGSPRACRGARRCCWPRTATSSGSTTTAPGSPSRDPAGRILIDGTRQRRSRRRGAARPAAPVGGRPGGAGRGDQPADRRARGDART